MAEETRKGGWRKAAREVQRESGRRELKSIPGEWVIVRKWSVTAQEKLAQARQGMELDEDGMPKDMQDGDLTSFHAIGIKYGVLDHSFQREDGTKESFSDEAFLNELMADFPEAEEEIFEYIAERNRPLEQKSDETSETAPSGS